MKLLGQTEASLSSYAVFWCVAFNDRATQIEVAKLTGLSAKTVSRVISQLGETRGGRGWITQAFDDSDRRLRRLTLSRKGRAVYQKMLRDLARFSETAKASGMEKAPMESGQFRRFPIVPISKLPLATPLSSRPLPWKLNEGHPGPGRVLSGRGIAQPVSLHGSRATGS